MLHVPQWSPQTWFDFLLVIATSVEAFVFVLLYRLEKAREDVLLEPRLAWSSQRNEWELEIANPERESAYIMKVTAIGLGASGLRSVHSSEKMAWTVAPRRSWRPFAKGKARLEITTIVGPVLQELAGLPADTTLTLNVVVDYVAKGKPLGRAHSYSVVANNGKLVKI